jgi:hypothetical protein
MSERFVRGWKVSLKKLSSLVGSRSLSAKDILKSGANEDLVTDVFMTLGFGKKKEGQSLATAALTDIFEGTLDPQRGSNYLRVLELLLSDVARPLDGTIELSLTNYLPNDSQGRLNPVLDILKLSSLAKAWAAPNVSFPWKSAKLAPHIAWPIWTSLEGRVLTDVRGELKGLVKGRLKEIPLDALAENEKYADATREELWAGLQTLRAWVDKAVAKETKERSALAKDGNALLLSLDGDS